MKQGKLVRDKIPAKLKKLNIQFKERRLSKAEYKRALTKKLLEEAQEFSDSSKLEELADVLEVIRAILVLKKTSWREMEKIRIQKRKANGGFENRVQLIVSGPGVRRLRHPKRTARRSPQARYPSNAKRR